MSAWKHSQYFFRQLLFLHWQPLACLLLKILVWKARGFRPRMLLIALSRSAELSARFAQSEQAQLSWHRKPPEKQSQYSLRHRVFLQRHLLAAGDVFCGLGTATCAGVIWILCTTSEATFREDGLGDFLRRSLGAVCGLALPLSAAFSSVGLSWLATLAKGVLMSDSFSDSASVDVWLSKAPHSSRAAEFSSARRTGLGDLLPGRRRSAMHGICSCGPKPILFTVSGVRSTRAALARTSESKLFASKSWDDRPPGLRQSGRRSRDGKPRCGVATGELECGQFPTLVKGALGEPSGEKPDTKREKGDICSESAGLRSGVRRVGSGLVGGVESQRLITAKSDAETQLREVADEQKAK
mmetsp:Transcript_8765/g.33057  ORF Transcript_8765/g.33057 Transcript_8765/m.33057 type:complete len:355 (+) Transcript_8765:1979-3043(+)|eukprot:scaffold1253_cov245-Pinguiococcus_pyrenoidosus.AAC.3